MEPREIAPSPPLRRPGAEPPSIGEFRQFARTSADFARVMMERLGIHPGTFTSEAVEANLAITRALFGKWAAEIIIVLYAERELGFEELRRHLPSVSPRVLSKKLKDLESFSIVHRETLSTHPPRVRYSLTENGIIVARLAEPIFLFLRVSARTAHPAPPRAKPPPELPA